MKRSPEFNRFATVLVGLFIIAGVLIVVFDWTEMKQIIGQADWSFLPLAFLFTGLSYFCLSYGLAVVFRAFGIRLGFVDLMQIGFVSSVVTYLMNVGGVTGLSLQFLLMKRPYVQTEDVLAASVFQLYFSSLMLMALLPIGLFNIAANHASPEVTLAISVAAGILAFLLLAASILVFVTAARSAMVRFLSRAVRFLIRHDVTSQLNDFDAAMTRGVALMRNRPVVFVTLLALTIGDWGATATALWFCFQALGQSLNIGTLLTGFGLGVTAGFISLVPGGLGVQEGSMAGIYALLNVPIRTAALAAILFRIVYYFVPFLVSLGFYRRLLRRSS